MSRLRRIDILIYIAPPQRLWAGRGSAQILAAAENRYEQQYLPRGER